MRLDIQGIFRKQVYLSCSWPEGLMPQKSFGPQIYTQWDGNTTVGGFIIVTFCSTFLGQTEVSQILTMENRISNFYTANCWDRVYHTFCMQTWHSQKKRNLQTTMSFQLKSCEIPLILCKILLTRSLIMVGVPGEVHLWWVFWGLL